jgi:hypothetical protein
MQPKQPRLLHHLPTIFWHHLSLAKLRGGDSTRLPRTIMLAGGEAAEEGLSSYVKPPALCGYVLYSILVPPSSSRGNAGMGDGGIVA